MQKGTYRLFVIGVLCVLLTAGTILGYKIGGNISKGSIDKDIDISENLPIIETPVMSSSEDKKEEYIILKKTQYELCTHIVESEDIIISTSIDEAIKEISDDYNLVSKGTNGAVFSKKEKGYCQNHYVITIKDSEVIVYRKIDDKEKEVYLNTDIPVNILRDDTKEDLEKGIEVDSVDKLNKIIEELES